MYQLKRGTKADQYKTIFLSKKTVELLNKACEIEHAPKQNLANEILQNELQKIINRDNRLINKIFKKLIK